MEAVNDDGRYLETHKGELYKGKTVRGWPGPARTRDMPREANHGPRPHGETVKLN